MKLYHIYTETKRHRHSVDGIQLQIQYLLLPFPPEFIEVYEYMIKSDESYKPLIVISISVEATN